MKQTTSMNSHDIDELVRQARLQRSAAMAQAIVGAAMNIGSAVKSAFGTIALSETPKQVAQPEQRTLKSSLANGR